MPDPRSPRASTQPRDRAAPDAVYTLDDLCARAGVTVRFYSLTVGSRTYDINAEPVRRQAEGSRGKDAQKIGIGAGAGAVIGGLLGGRKGAVIGAAAGGAGGTGMVLATKGSEVRLPAGTTVTTTLTDPLVIER